MTNDFQKQQALAGLEQLATLVRAQSWRQDGTPSLPPTQSAVLRMLEGAAAPLRAAQIAERLGISAASLSDSLKALETKCWLLRTADPADKRASLLNVTDAGREIVARLNDPQQGMAALMNGLSEQDVGAFLRVTQLLVHEAQQKGLATGSRTCLGCRFFRPGEGNQPGKPHFCAFVQQPFGDPELRVDCAEQQPADEQYAEESLLRFRQLNSH